MPDTTTRPWLCPQTDCPATTHDKYSAHRHGCRSGAAREDERRYKKRQRLGLLTPRWVDATGVRRRIQACGYMGHSLTDIAAELGTARQVVSDVLRQRWPQMNVASRDRMIPVLDRLAGQLGSDSRIAMRARRENWQPLAAWDDIDDPAAEPVLSGRPWIDPRAEQVAELFGYGLSREAISAKLGIGPDEVRRAYRRYRLAMESTGNDHDDDTAVEAVRDGRLRLADVSVLQQEAVVTAMWRDQLTRVESPGPVVAELLGVERAEIDRIRSRAFKRRQRKEKS